MPDQVVAREAFSVDARWAFEQAARWLDGEVGSDEERSAVVRACASLIRSRASSPVTVPAAGDAKDFEHVQAVLEDVAAHAPRCCADGRSALVALERIRARRM